MDGSIHECQKSFENDLEKGKKMPIGTVSKGRKKVAEGKWVEIKDDKGGNGMDSILYVHCNNGWSDDCRL